MLEGVGSGRGMELVAKRTSGLVDKSEKEGEFQWACSRKVPGNASGSLRSLQPYYHIKGGEPPIGLILLPRGRQKTKERSKDAKSDSARPATVINNRSHAFPHHSTLTITARRTFPAGQSTETVHVPAKVPYYIPGRRPLLRGIPVHAFIR